MPYIGRSEKFGVRNRFYYTQSSGGATSISGADDAGKTLTFTDGAYVDVFLNGIALVAGTDYNTTTADTIAGLASLSNGDVIEVLVYDVFNVADTVSASSGGTFSGGVTMGSTLAVTGALTLTGDVSTTGDFKPTGKEYFHVDLTTAQGSLASQSTVTVDFGGSGTVKYDTKSKFDSANDAYLLDSSDGVYLISFSVGMRSQSISTETIKDGAVQIRVATDGSTFTPIIGNGAHLQNDANEEVGSVAFSGSFIYKSTTATTKIDMQAYCDIAGSDSWTVSDDVNLNTDNSPTGSSTARCTFLSIVRIA